MGIGGLVALVRYTSMGRAWRAIAQNSTGAQVVAREIADNLGNVTRFIVLARQGAPPTGDDKTSFCFGFTATDRAGSLVGALQAFADRGIL